MVITKEVLDRFFEEANLVGLNSFFKEASPLVHVALKKTADFLLEEPSLERFTAAFQSIFLLCYRQRNKSIKEWVESYFEGEVTEEEKRCLKANAPWFEEQVASAYFVFLAGGCVTSLLVGTFYLAHTCIQMQKEITE